MSSKEDCHHIIIYITQPTRNIMRALGAWPSIGREKSICNKFYKLLLISISYILLSCDLIPAIFYWIMEKTTRVRLQIIPVLLYNFMAAGQYGIFILRDDRIRQCLKHVEDDWRNVINVDARSMMLTSARTGRRLVTFCGVLMYGGAFTFRTILPLSQGKFVTEDNVTIRLLACPGYYFSIDVQISPTYEILFVIQLLSGLISASIVTSACGFTAIFVVHACGQLKILINLMEKLVEKQWRAGYEVDDKLAEVVKHQIRVRHFLRLVQHTLQHVCLMEIMANTITICVLVYLMLMAEQVAITSCELEWYRLPGRKARSIVLLMIMSNTPTKISAGKLIDLSLKTFGQVMKTAGAYFNMLRSITE
ncbi:odorant receptor 4-like isoform X2 [Anoplolepis gracilipes]|uniref:odorant receptor 4-like isoform X2 n=1 Tax=Anoplolepis gracilipes TaxID=354296 RepID=UPI003BA1D204